MMGLGNWKKHEIDIMFDFSKMNSRDFNSKLILWLIIVKKVI